MSFCRVEFSTADLCNNLAKAGAALALFIGLVSVAHCGAGCTPPRTAAEVEAAYTAELVHCSVVAKDLAEAKACRHGVNTKYGLCDKSSYPKVTPCDESLDGTEQ